MKVELGLGVWDCSLASTATLLPPLWPNNGINLAFASHAQRQPFHFTCTAASPFHSTYSLAPPVLFPCVAWRVTRGLFCVGLAGSGACQSPPAPQDLSGEVTTRCQASPSPAGRSHAGQHPLPSAQIGKD